ncbi:MULTISPECIES: late competence development ComFB family protein [Vibrio]|uniref:late competence development ComFB family protein n=1 Tax=Vibrio TaxID=662 RepID=UPI001BD1C697|nr:MULTISPECIES: late competence development ComFB family protein [Vibrio]ELA6646585.1 late competence development ComFB family protein [Vibrio alginolyticus]MBS9917870.1 late competence development ComFB family protein [Vibrio alginolyticus]MCA2450756.1 late competence development ComFB family protein [Vibrio alginolyticus]MCA2474152.1 late competence development ComFB family protein [Vibrio alginolyticus]MDW1964632.1 late competence development ComFB family protein [Vibrio sp. Vb0587]
MQISSDVHNYMETLVGQVLSLPEFLEQYDNEQLADIACLALIQLKPVYIRHDIDFLSSLSEQKLSQFKQSADIAVKNAAEMVKEDRRKNREYDVPVIFSHTSYDDDKELDWYEKPILNVNIK